MTIKYLIEKEFKQLWRNKFIITLIFVLPCLVMLVFPWATTMEVKNINISLIDMDKSGTSRLLADKISHTSYFTVTGEADNYNDALKEVESGLSDIIVQIPVGFEKSIMNERKASVMLSANAVDGTKADFGVSYLNAIIADFAEEMTREGGGEVSVVSADGISIEPYFRYNPRKDYKIPMIPALIVLIMSLLVGFLPSMNIVGEKETGTIEQINVSPVSKIAFIAGKLIPYWIIGLIVLTLAIIVTYLIYGLAPEGSLLLLYGVAVFFILGISGLGLIISNHSSIMQQAMFMIFFLVVIFILMSGVFTPISSMPLWAQYIAKIDPLTYFSEIMKLIYLKGSTLPDLLQYIYPLLIFFVVVFAWAILSYRKRG